MTPAIAITLGLAAFAAAAARVAFRLCQRRAQRAGREAKKRRVRLADMLDTMTED